MTVTSAGPPEVQSSDEERRTAAIRRLRKRRDFHRHLLAYVLVNTAIVVIWLITASASGVWFPWPLFPILGWGIGLAFHALDTYGSDITEDDIQREMARRAM